MISLITSLTTDPWWQFINCKEERGCDYVYVTGRHVTPLCHIFLIQNQQIPILKCITPPMDAMKLQ